MTFWRELRNGDAMPLDSYGFLTNQVGHSAGGLAVAHGLMLLGAGAWAFWLAPVVYWVVIEFFKQMRGRLDVFLLGDSLVDTAFFGAGVAFWVLAAPAELWRSGAVILLVAAALAWGVWRRL